MKEVIKAFLALVRGVALVLKHRFFPKKSRYRIVVYSGDTPSIVWEERRTTSTATEILTQVAKVRHEELVVLEKIENGRWLVVKTLRLKAKEVH